MQTIPQRLSDAVDSDKQTLNQKVSIAWDLDSYDADVVFAEVDSSLVDGRHIVKGYGDAVTEWDKYLYTDETQNLMYYEFVRDAGWPLNEVVKSRGSVALSNTSRRYLPHDTPFSGEEDFIGDHIKAGRFIRVHAGYGRDIIPQFVGITERPVNSVSWMDTKINFFDVIEYLEGKELDGALLQNKKGDEVIKHILDELGFTEDQYDLSESLNMIPFVNIKGGDKALDIIRKVCEAENGRFYADEHGILKFENRFRLAFEPYTESQYTFNYDNSIIESILEPTEVINKAFITAYPREVQANQKVWDFTGGEMVRVSSSVTIWADIFDDYGDLPCTNIYEWTNGSYFLATDKELGDGTDVTSDFTVTEFSVLGGSTVKMTFRNDGSKTSYINEIALFGTPAKVKTEIEYETPDADATASIAEFGVKAYELRNDFIQSENEARGLGRTLVYTNKDPKKSIEIKVKGIPQIQIDDQVTVQEGTTEEELECYIIRIEKLADGYNQRLILKERVIQSFAIVDTSLVDGDDVVA